MPVMTINIQRWEAHADIKEKGDKNLISSKFAPGIATHNRYNDELI